MDKLKPMQLKELLEKAMNSNLYQASVSNIITLTADLLQ